MRCLVAAFAVAAVLCAAHADAVSPHHRVLKAMKARGPVSPFPIEESAAPTARVPSPPPVTPQQAAAAKARLVDAVNKVVDAYFHDWNWDVATHQFDAHPAVKLYVGVPSFHTLVLSHAQYKAEAAKLRLKFDGLTGQHAKREYATAMSSLISTAIRWVVSEHANPPVPGQQRVVNVVNTKTAHVVAHIHTALGKDLKTPWSRVAGKVELTLEHMGEGEAAGWLIKSEKITVTK